MKAINPYLNFDGRTREAMEFYAKVLGAKLEIMTNKESGMPGPGEDRIMHAKLGSGSTVIMASDSQHGMPVDMGNNVWISVDCSSVAEQDKHFNGISEGGTVVMPLANQFWGARFGMVKDKFGLGWMFNCQVAKPKAASKPKAKKKTAKKAARKAAKKKR